MEKPWLAERSFAETAGDRPVVVDSVCIYIGGVWNLHRNKLPIDQLEGTGDEPPSIIGTNIDPDNRVPLVNSVEVRIWSGTDGVINLCLIIATLHESVKKLFSEITDLNARVIHPCKPCVFRCGGGVLKGAHAPIRIASQPEQETGAVHRRRHHRSHDGPVVVDVGGAGPRVAAWGLKGFESTCCSRLRSAYGCNSEQGRG